LSLTDVLRAVAVEPVDGELLDEQYERRLGRCGELSRAAAERCLGLLVASQKDGGEDRELMEDLVLLALSWPRLAEKAGVELVPHARRLAELCLLDGELERARALLERVSEAAPDHRGLERDLIVVLRESGDVEALARRCLARAKREIDAGAPLEAIPWLQEVLVADPARRDVARLIRDLRFESAERKQRRQRLRRSVCLGAGLMLLGCAAVWREVEVRREYEELPSADPTRRNSIELRLSALAAFAESNPIWHGMHTVSVERARLDAALDRLARDERTHAARLAEQRRRDRLEAELILGGLERLIEYGELQRALTELDRALALGGETWAARDRALRDRAAIAELLQTEESP
jgi:hypothetical protein